MASIPSSCGIFEYYDLTSNDARSVVLSTAEGK